MLKSSLARLRTTSYDLKRKSLYPLDRVRADDLYRNYLSPAVVVMQVTSVPLYLLFAATEFWTKVAENVLCKD